VVATRGSSHLLWWLPLNIWTRGVASCRFKSNFTSTNQSVLLSVGLCNVPLNTWTQGLSPVNSLSTFLPLTSLSYCLLASVRTRRLSPVSSHPTCLPLASLSYWLSASGRCPSTHGLGGWVLYFPIGLSFHWPVCLTVCRPVEDAPQQLDTGAESCKFPSDFPSTGQSVLLSVSQCKVPLNTWTWGLLNHKKLPTFNNMSNKKLCLIGSQII